MPVNMTPKRKRAQPEAPPPASEAPPQQTFGEETELDREKAIADAESKNLWDQTEVIDMDQF